MVAMEDDSYRALDILARALFAQGRPLAVVRESLDRKWRATPEKARPAVQLTDGAYLAIATGDFVSAKKDARALEKLAEDTASELDRRQAATLLVELDGELGEPVLAAQTADAYLHGAPSNRR